MTSSIPLSRDVKMTKDLSAITDGRPSKNDSDCTNGVQSHVRHRRQRRARLRHNNKNLYSIFASGGLPFVIFLLVLIAIQCYIFTWRFSSVPSSTMEHGSLSIPISSYTDFLTHRGKQKGKKKDMIHPMPHHVTPPRGGIIVLGMHRSGTSMLTGLLVDGFGYHVGEPLIQPGYDNEKGFYELLPVVLQNDAFLYDQQMDWSYDVIHYNSTLASQHFNASTRQSRYDFSEGQRALHFLNNPLNVPWVVKDPRLCITLSTWLPLLNEEEPAVLFTYRHPLEVASSLTKRQGFPLEHGLRLWIVYNMRAIQNSKGLCRVFSSNNKILAQPNSEVVRIVQELERQCHVVKPSKSLTQSVVDSFVDASLQHVQRKTVQQRIAEGQAVLQRFPYQNNGKGMGDEDDCVAFELKSSLKLESEERKREKNMYLLAMKIYCDFASGKAFEDDYEWPHLL